MSGRKDNPRMLAEVVAAFRRLSMFSFFRVMNTRSSAYAKTEWRLKMFWGTTPASLTGCFD